MAQALAIAASDLVLGRKSRSISIARDIVLVVLGSGLVAVAAQISIPLPFTPVPITGQTFAVLLVGASLGAARGGLSMLLYLLWGALGFSVYANGTSGVDVLVGATGGYLFGFVIASLVTGALAQRGWDRRFGSAIGAMLTGNVIIYIFGIVWLAPFLDAPIISQKVLLAGLYPFILGDILKLYLASAALPGAWKLVKDKPAGADRSRNSVV